MSTFLLRSPFHEIRVCRRATVELPESINQVVYALIGTAESDSIACQLVGAMVAV